MVSAPLQPCPWCSGLLVGAEVHSWCFCHPPGLLSCVPACRCWPDLCLPPAATTNPFFHQQCRTHIHTFQNARLCSGTTRMNFSPRCGEFVSMPLAQPSLQILLHIPVHSSVHKYVNNIWACSCRKIQLLVHTKHPGSRGHGSCLSIKHNVWECPTDTQCCARIYEINRSCFWYGSYKHSVICVGLHANVFDACALQKQAT